jgi:hypothetical protein
MPRESLGQLLTRWYDWNLQQARGVGLDGPDAEAQRMRTSTTP